MDLFDSIIDANTPFARGGGGFAASRKGTGVTVTVAPVSTENPETTAFLSQISVRGYSARADTDDSQMIVLDDGTTTTTPCVDAALAWAAAGEKISRDDFDRGFT